LSNFFIDYFLIDNVSISPLHVWCLNFWFGLVFMDGLLHDRLVLLLLLVFFKVKVTFGFCDDVKIVPRFLMTYFFSPFLFFNRVFDEDRVWTEIVGRDFPKSFVFEVRRNQSLGFEFTLNNIFLSNDLSQLFLTLSVVKIPS